MGEDCWESSIGREEKRISRNKVCMENLVMKPLLYILLKKNNKNRAEEIAQQLGALASLIEDAHGG